MQFNVKSLEMMVPNDKDKQERLNSLMKELNSLMEREGAQLRIVGTIPFYLAFILVTSLAGLFLSIGIAGDHIVEILKIFFG